MQLSSQKKKAMGILRVVFVSFVKDSISQYMMSSNMIYGCQVTLGYNRKKLEKKHWAEMIENPRRPIIHWHVLKVTTSTPPPRLPFLKVASDLATSPNTI